MMLCGEGAPCGVVTTAGRCGTFQKYDEVDGADSAREQNRDDQYNTQITSHAYRLYDAV